MNISCLLLHTNYKRITQHSGDNNAESVIRYKAHQAKLIQYNKYICTYKYIYIYI